MKWFKYSILALVLGVLFAFWYLFIGVSSNQSGSFYNRGNNAVWLDHYWVGEEKSEKEIFELVENFKKHGIGTVFVHTGPLKSDGTIDPETYRYAISFLEQARYFDKEIQYEAWLGQIRSKIDLSNPEIRHNVSKQALILSEFMDFDGVHFDIEPVWDGDTDFIQLLKETRDVINEKKKISVALAEFIPKSFIFVSKMVKEFENFNSEVNYENVAKYADSIVVMTYATGFEYEWLYKWLVKEQTIWVTNLLDDTRVFIGIPAYERSEHDPNFNEKVENMESGLKGIIEGLNNFRSREENFEGVAIYPYWEIDEKEWQTYDDLWLN